MASKPLVIADPYPQKLETIFNVKTLSKLKELVDLKTGGGIKMTDEELEKYLPDAMAVIGQCPMPRERLQKAKELKAILNVEGNFYQNIDYETCFQRNIYVLNCGDAYSQAVAEMALCFALDLARGVSLEDRRFREGTEGYGRDHNEESLLLFQAKVGLVGFGNLGKAFRKLLTPFRCEVKAFDPWLPDSILIHNDCIPSSLEDILATSQFIFVFAGVTDENKGFLGARELDLIQPGAVFLLMSRAAVVDFDELIRRVAAGKFKAATDVFPEEPLAPDHLIRKVDNMLLSPHRAGAISQALQKIGEMVLDDLELIVKKLPPVRMQHARIETATRFRNPSAESIAVQKA